MWAWYRHDNISSEVLNFFIFVLEKKVDGKLFSGIHLVSALLAAFICLANNILSLCPQAIAILICCLLQYMFNVGGKKIVIPGIYFLNNVCITYVLTSPAFAASFICVFSLM